MWLSFVARHYCSPAERAIQSASEHFEATRTSYSRRLTVDHAFVTECVPFYFVSAVVMWLSFVARNYCSPAERAMQSVSE